MGKIFIVAIASFSLLMSSGCSENKTKNNQGTAVDDTKEQTTDTAQEDAGTDGTDAGDTAQEDAGTDGTTAAEDTSSKPEPTMGLSTQTLEHDNLVREYTLYVPKSYDGSTPVPLMLNFHGFEGTASDHMQNADMRPLADSENFILIYPQGTELDGAPHWNTYPIGAGGKSSTDDLGFINALLDVILKDYAIDSSRVYAAGYSNGGDFTYSLACYMNDRITGIAPVSGLMWVQTMTDCKTSHPTAVISLHGTADFTRPYDGYEGYLLSIPESLELWAGKNNISGAATKTTISDGGVQIERHDYPNGDGNVSIKHYKVINGQHVWLKFKDDGVDSNRLIWNFLSQFNQQGLK